MKITSNGPKISNDPMPIGWGRIDWSKKDWGYENINLDTIGEYNGTTQESCEIARDVAIKDDIAYIARGCYGIEIIDVKNPEEPNLIGLYNTNFSSNLSNSNLCALKIDLHDNYAFISVGYGGILILDISNSSNPEFISIINNLYPQSLLMRNFKIFNDLLLVPVDSDGLHIWNISDPFNPFFISLFPKDLFNSDVDIQDNIIYLTCERNGLLILDIYNIYVPILIGNYDCYAKTVVVNKDLAYAANHTGISVLNISNPLNIKFINSFGDNYYSTLKFNNNYLYGISRYNSELNIFNCSDIDKEEQRLIGRFYNQGSITGIFIDEFYIYLASSYTSFIILDKNFEPLEPSQPTNSIPNFNNFYLAFGMILGVIYIISKLKSKNALDR